MCKGDKIIYQWFSINKQKETLLQPNSPVFYSYRKKEKVNAYVGVVSFSVENMPVAVRRERSNYLSGMGIQILQIRIGSQYEQQQ